MENKKLRIFLGPSWYGEITPTLASAMRESGANVTCALDKRVLNMYPDAAFDITIDFQRSIKLWRMAVSIKYFLQYLFKHDAFIFVAGISLLPYNLDLPILKLLGKITVMWFIGSDIRHFESVEEANKKMAINYQLSEALRQSLDQVKHKKEMIRRVEKYVDYIISAPAISHLLTRKYYRLYAPVDINNIIFNNVTNSRPVVVHAPSNDEKKGTSHIIEAVEQLKKEGYDFELHLFRNTPNKVVRDTLTNADIAIDQLYATTAGIFAIEAMAAGCAVLGGNRPELSHRKGLPVIHTDPDNIYQNLKMLLENPELRRELGEKGRKYVEEHHDTRKVAGDILNLISGKVENLVTYDPKL